MDKWYKTHKVDPKKTKWCSEDDELLMDLILKKQKSSKENNMAAKINVIQNHQFMNEEKKQSRPFKERGSYSKEEDLTLLKQWKIHGRQWQKIAKGLGTTKTDQSVRNRFGRLISKGKEDLLN